MITEGMFRTAVAQLGGNCLRSKERLVAARAARDATKAQIEKCEHVNEFGRVGGGRSHFWGQETAKMAESKELREQYKKDEALIAECLQAYQKEWRELETYAHRHLSVHDPAYANILVLIQKTKNLLAAAIEVNRQIAAAGGKVSNAKIGEAADFLIAGGPIGLGVAAVSWFLTRNAGKLEDLNAALRRFRTVSADYDRQVNNMTVEAPYLGTVNNIGLLADIFDFGDHLLNAANFYQLHKLGNKIGTIKERFVLIESNVKDELERLEDYRTKYIENLAVACMKDYKSPA